MEEDELVETMRKIVNERREEEKQIKYALMEADAKRYRFIREMKVNMTPKMDGQHHYHFNQIYAKGNTFNEAIDNEMKRLGYE